ncbi:MAG: hypothetical protein LUG21_03645, partial [Clostridiales bacterium]|nr:hypothetical protein [Clostridiales bacterium]
INDTLKNKSCKAKLKIMDFNGKIIKENSTEIASCAGSSLKALVISAKGLNKKQAFANAELYINNELICEKSIVFHPERKLNLKKANIKITTSKNSITLKSETYARKVFIDIKGETEPLSDNCFDLIPNREKPYFLKAATKLIPII